VDDSVGRIMSLLRERGLLESTIVMFMGDNGFAFGEHGLIDKRTAYEESMRVPLLMGGGGLPAGVTVDHVVANIDIAPTILEAAGLAGASMDGASMLPLARGEKIQWRDVLLYEYYWERNFPQTPAMHAVRGSRYKYIRYYGLWDTDELYDLQADPLEARNLIRDTDQRDTVSRMNKQLFAVLSATGGMYIPISPDAGAAQNLRRKSGSRQAEFPPYMFAPKK
jgi:N-acetylglucosamine-6-sulfatase